jgi:two-component system sensor histidine kinase TctE
VVHAERILAQLLLLARIDEAASNRMAMRDVDLSELARSKTADEVLRARAAGIDLGFAGEDGVAVRGDPMLLGELLHNLIDNAVSYAGAGAEVTVGVRRDGERAILEVEDTGPGIPAERLPEVRRRFSRGEGTRPGAGLGLPVVEEIAGLFAGRLELLPGSGGRGLLARVDFPVSPTPILPRAGDRVSSPLPAAAK